MKTVLFYSFNKMKEITNNVCKIIRHKTKRKRANQKKEKSHESHDRDILKLSG